MFKYKEGDRVSYLDFGDLGVGTIVQIDEFDKELVIEDDEGALTTVHEADVLGEA